MRSQECFLLIYLHINHLEKCNKTPDQVNFYKRLLLSLHTQYADMYTSTNRTIWGKHVVFCAFIFFDLNLPLTQKIQWFSMTQLSVYIIISRWWIKGKNVTHNILQKNRIYLYEAHKAKPNISFLKHVANLMSLCGG